MIAFVDLDGTIIDSFRRHYVLLNNILIKYGFDGKFIYDDYYIKKVNGFNNFKYMTEVLNISVEFANKIQKEWIEKIESKEMLILDKLYDDSIDFLEFLKSKDYKIIFLTARNNKELTLFQLKKLGLSKYPTKVIVVDPRNGIANKCTIIDKEKNHNSIIIGDTEIDYKSSVHCKIKSYILNRGFRSIEFLNNIGVNKTYVDLYKVMEEIDDKEL